MNNIGEFFLDLRDDTLDFIENHLIAIIVTVIAIIALIIGIYTVVRIVSPVKITISNADSTIGNIVATKADSVDLVATATKNGKEVESTFSWSTSNGLLTQNNDGSVTWKLPTDEGTYSITVDNGEVTSTKYITVIGNELSELYKSSDYQILLQDTDGDGLTDLYEGSTSGTSQTEEDTDGDGLYDGDEIIMNLDPLVADSKGDGLRDGDRTLEYTFTNNNVTLSMVGVGNFTRTSVDVYETETLQNTNYVLNGTMYAIYTEVELESAEVTIKYSSSGISSKGLSESSLAVYAFDEDTNSFTKMKTTVDISNKTLTFTTTELGKYFIADSSKLTSNTTTELFFLIDNSASMYSKDEYENSEENDPEFKRVDVINNMIEKLPDNYKIGAGKFTYEYTEIIGLVADKASVQNKISTMKTTSENFSGTYLAVGLQGAISQFTDDDETNRKYIVVLCDGKDTESNEDYDEELLEEQIELAVKKGIKIYVVGLGESIDEEILSDIADQTGGKYYYAATADDLEPVYDQISADMNYNLYDSDKDLEDDSIILADSGFYITSDGFSFSNFSNSQVEYGYSYGMVLYAKLYFEGKLPDSLGAKKVTLNDGTVIEAPAANFSDITPTSSKLNTYVPTSLTVLSELPDDFWSSSATAGTLSINSNVKSDLKKLGFSTYTVSYSNPNAGFSKYESIQLDVSVIFEEENKNEYLKNEDVNMLKILSRLDITKYRDDKFYFYDNNDTAMETLKDTLNSGSPVMIRINDDYTVLAVKLLANSENMNKYKIEVYDPNYAGVYKYIEVERYKFSDITEISNVVTDRYEYKFSYQGVDVGICLSFPNVEEND